MWLRHLVWHVLLVTVFQNEVECETGNAYHGPPQARELFTYNDKQFYFYSDRVTWNEANAICEADNMHLAEFDTSSKAKWAVECISQAWIIFEDMWIGAKKNKLNRWLWQFTNKVISEEPTFHGNFSFMYPPWIDDIMPLRIGKDCLAIDRNGHDDPYFVDLACNLPRTFICEENYKRNVSDPWQAAIVEDGNTKYMLYHGRLSWFSAVTYCQQQGYSLATISDMKIARKLAKAMLKARPEFEDAWIGASFKDNVWVWVENGEEIKTIPATLRNSNGPFTHKNILVPQFPPWIQPKNRQARECAIFDRHLCHEPAFIDLKCNRQRDFICSKKITPKELLAASPIRIDRGQKRYIFFPVLATWEEGNAICEAEGSNTTMLVLNDAEETKFIMQTMADARNPIVHLWLGGRVVDGKWKWHPGREPIDDISMTPNDDGFPPWCDEENDIDVTCLNLDRQNHWTPIIYGLECNKTQAVACEQPIIKSTEYLLDYSPKTETPYKVRITKMNKTPLASDQARDYCKSDIGILWQPPLQNNLELTELKNFYKKVKSTQPVSAEIVVYHVDGGRYNAKKRQWSVVGNNKKVYYKDIPTKWKPHDGDCLVGQINRTADDWSWFPVKCYHQLHSQVICQTACSVSEIPYDKPESEWICDAIQSDLFGYKLLGMTCDHYCPAGKVLQGPYKFVCIKSGWFNKHRAQVNSSKCIDVKEGLFLFENAIKTKNVSSLSFIIDSSASNSPLNYAITKYLMAVSIDYIRAGTEPQTKNGINEPLELNIVSMEPNAESGGSVQIKTKNIKVSNCEYIQKELNNLVQSDKETVRDFGEAFSTVKDLLADTDIQQSVVVFVTPGGNQKGSFALPTQEINRQAKVFAIGTTKLVPVHHLTQIGSKLNKEVLSVQFKKPEELIRAAKGLHDSCDKCKCKEVASSMLSGFNDGVIKKILEDKPKKHIAKESPNEVTTKKVEQKQSDVQQV